MNGAIIQDFLSVLKQQKILDNICLFEQIFQRKQSLGVPVFCPARKMERKKSTGPAVIFQLENIVIFCTSSIETPEIIITHSFIVVFQDESALDRHLFLLAKRPKAWETQETETKAGYESRQPIKVHVRIKEKKKTIKFQKEPLSDRFSSLCLTWFSYPAKRPGTKIPYPGHFHI